MFWEKSHVPDSVSRSIEDIFPFDNAGQYLSSLISMAIKISGSSTLRAATHNPHREFELALGLPESVRSIDDYRRLLQLLYGMYKPIETRLSEFAGWSDWGISIGVLRQANALSNDLTALLCNVTLVELAKDCEVPVLDTFGRALGALYVLEASRQGGRSILQSLTGRQGINISHANVFFTGQGEKTCALWSNFKASLDRFTDGRPQQFPEVIEGARATLAAFHSWMAQFKHG
jgi:heme oxygenase